MRLGAGHGGARATERGVYAGAGSTTYRRPSPTALQEGHWASKSAQLPGRPQRGDLARRTWGPSPMTPEQPRDRRRRGHWCPRARLVWGMGGGNIEGSGVADRRAGLSTLTAGAAPGKRERVDCWASVYIEQPARPRGGGEFAALRGRSSRARHSHHGRMGVAPRSGAIRQGPEARARPLVKWLRRTTGTTRTDPFPFDAVCDDVDGREEIRPAAGLCSHDIAYPRQITRGFADMIDVWGAEPRRPCERMKPRCGHHRQQGFCLDVKLCQLVAY